jgi:hypothetical protein
VDCAHALMWSENAPLTHCCSRFGVCRVEACSRSGVCRVEWKCQRATAGQCCSRFGVCRVLWKCQHVAEGPECSHLDACGVKERKIGGMGCLRPFANERQTEKRGTQKQVEVEWPRPRLAHAAHMHAHTRTHMCARRARARTHMHRPTPPAPGRAEARLKPASYDAVEARMPRTRTHMRTRRARARTHARAQVDAKTLYPTVESHCFRAGRPSFVFFALCFSCVLETF